MYRLTITFLCSILCISFSLAQEVIPFDTAHWEIKAKAYVLENYKGHDAIYLHQGSATLKEVEFLNGTIEFDVYLTERQSFPGVYFRAFEPGNMESFFLRPHLSGKPDANQAAPIINGLTAWQLYFGPAYSFAYDYNFNGWTHIKMVIHGQQGQVYLDYSEKPHLSWKLKHPAQKGKVAIGGSFAPMHYANFKINHEQHQIIDFAVKEKEMIKGIINDWDISDKFEESQLDDPSNLQPVIKARKWDKKIQVEENSAANISRVFARYGSEGNTVFARLKINSEKEQIKVFEFGYSDRVVAILNGKAIYKGTNKWRTRDYRYLGTVGLFDAIYLHLKKGENTLLLAVSEDFGGWGVTGKFENEEGITIK